MEEACEFRSWAELIPDALGDDISIQYSGTPALKGDFVRYLLMNLSQAFSVPHI